MAGPLEGIRVLDHGHVWAGPLVGTSLSDLGAEVIKVLSPSRSSGVSMAGRVMPGAVGGVSQVDTTDPAQYHGYERGKLGVSINLASEEGKALYRRLIAVSDIVVENFSPRVMPSLGLGFEDLQKVNPGIILCSMSATGATEGPWRDLVTYGPSLGALYGVKSLLGYHDDPMPREDMADLDPTAAGHAVFAILAALEYRARTGTGQHIEMAQGEAAIQRIAEPLMDYMLNGRVARTQGNRYPGVAPHGVYRAMGDDDWISIVARDEREWEALVSVASVAGHDLASPRFKTLQRRLAEQDALDEAITAWTIDEDAMDLTRRLQSAGVPATPVMSAATLVADENFHALRRSALTLGPAVGVSADDIYQGVVWKLTGTPGGVQRTVPGTGADNARVFGGLLGLTAPEIEKLREHGAI
ncbi:MAG: CaiB/BaiF CoA transferase family protein [Dehalococcoidia bacterium]